MEKPFKTLGLIETPHNLQARTLGKIEVARKKAALRKVIGFGLIEIASIATAVVSFVYIFQNVATSGMFEYLSLIFTDTAASLAYSKELVLSVLETLPAASLAIALCASVACAWSTARIIKISRIHNQYI